MSGLGSGELRHHRLDGVEIVSAEHDVRDPVPLPAVLERLHDGFRRADQDMRRLQHLVGRRAAGIGQLAENLK